MIEDYHVHSVFSPDGHNSPEEILSEAEKAGIDEIMFTDHCECNNNGAIPPEEEQWPSLDVTGYTQKLEALRNRTKVSFGIGVEIGQATQNPEYANRIIESYNWDFIIGSLHNIRDKYDFCYLNYREENLDVLFGLYFEQLFETVCTQKFSVLGHLYYPVRYVYRQGMTVNISAHDEKIREILKKLAENGQGLEVNTSGLFCPFNDMIPQYKYVKWFNELGGIIVTTGSDSHYADRVGRGCSEAKEMISEAGFKYISTYRNMKPIFTKI